MRINEPELYAITWTSLKKSINKARQQTTYGIYVFYIK